MILSLGLCDGRPQPILHLRHARGLRHARAARFDFQFALADGQDHRFVGRLGLDVRGMSDAVGAGERHAQA